MTAADALLIYSTFNPGDDVRQVVLLLVTRDAVERIDLGKAWELHEASLAWGKRIRSGQSDVAEAARVGRLLGLEHCDLGSRKRLLLADSPVVDALPFAALLDGSGKRLVERVAVIRSSALTFEINSRKTPGANKRLVMVGDVDYGQPSRSSGAPRWNPLPATKIELEAVKRAADARQLETTIIRGRRATKKEVLAVAKDARYLHLATHADVIRRVSEWNVATDPFKYTGVILADANQEGSKSVLSGAEACLLDLSATELVVLAGCRTNAGVPFSDNTSASLAHAFHVAGARNVIASLWSVNDEAAAALSRLFYHYHLVEDLPIHEALRNAQLELYRHPELIPSIAKSRGPDFSRIWKASKLPPKSGRRTPTHLWATFSLYGAGGLETPQTGPSRNGKLGKTSK